MFLHTIDGDQTFFINTCLLNEETVLEDRIWLRLSHGTFAQSYDPPHEVVSLLKTMLSAISARQLMLCYWIDTCTATLVALAGVLLEYAVIYVPSPSTFTLDGEVSICRVVLSGDNEHVLLQFSYPVTLTETPTMGSSNMHPAVLLDHFETRLQKTRCEWSAIRLEFDVRSEIRLCL